MKNPVIASKINNLLLKVCFILESLMPMYKNGMDNKNLKKPKSKSVVKNKSYESEIKAIINNANDMYGSNAALFIKNIYQMNM